MGDFYYLRPSDQAWLSFWKKDFTKVIKMSARITTMKSSALQCTLAIFNTALNFLLTLPLKRGRVLSARLLQNPCCCVYIRISQGFLTGISEIDFCYIFFCGFNVLKSRDAEKSNNPNCTLQGCSVVRTISKV